MIFYVFCVFVGKACSISVKKTQFPSFVFAQVVQKHYLNEVGK